jgi:hypothetical protein
LEASRRELALSEQARDAWRQLSKQLDTRSQRAVCIDR